MFVIVKTLDTSADIVFASFISEICFLTRIYIYYPIHGHRKLD